MVQHRTGRRPSRASEAAAQYAPTGFDLPSATPIYHVTVTDRGRLVLPAEVRAKLRIRDGDRLAIAIEADGTISVTTPNAAIGQLRGMFKRLAPTDHFASDDLIAERRRQALMDDRRNRDPVAGRGRTKKRR
jgi:AbrB family looped-hinge helix DNA binding protein